MSSKNQKCRGWKHVWLKLCSRMLIWATKRVLYKHQLDDLVRERSCIETKSDEDIQCIHRHRNSHMGNFCLFSCTIHNMIIYSCVLEFCHIFKSILGGKKTTTYSTPTSVSIFTTSLVNSGAAFLCLCFIHPITWTLKRGVSRHLSKWFWSSVLEFSTILV